MASDPFEAWQVINVQVINVQVINVQVVAMYSHSNVQVINVQVIAMYTPMYFFARKAVRPSNTTKPR
jgi:hypothetical protein